MLPQGTFIRELALAEFTVERFSSSMCPFGNSIIFWQQELLWFSPEPVRPFIELFCCFHGQDMKSSPREDEMR